MLTIGVRQHGWTSKLWNLSFCRQTLCACKRFCN